VRKRNEKFTNSPRGPRTARNNYSYLSIGVVVSLSSAESGYWVSLRLSSALLLNVCQLLYLLRNWCTRCYNSWFEGSTVLC